MKLTWLGHACFLLEADGYRIVTDPYTGVPGYPSLSVSAHAVFCSHGHFDHNAVDCVTLLPHRDSPFTVREIASFHDDRGGTLRGGNTIRVFTADGISVAHLGDLGHPLSAGSWPPLSGGRGAGAGGRCLYTGRRRGKIGVRRPEAPAASSPCTTATLLTGWRRWAAWSRFSRSGRRRRYTVCPARP